MSLMRMLLASFTCSLVLLAGCGPETRIGETAVDTDRQLAAEVRAALAGASDLPAGLSVEVSAGVVTISGALDCEECGGNRTPGASGTVQQSLGTVVRAVPGVAEVRFELDYAYD